jgi:hypothetical protein
MAGVGRGSIVICRRTGGGPGAGALATALTVATALAVSIATALLLVACSPPANSVEEQLGSCRRRVEQTRVDELFYSMEVAKCMELNGFRMIDQAQGLLNSTNWRKN